MQIPRPTEDDRARFQGLVPADERVPVKPMFGNLGAYVHGNMFMGLFGSDVGLRLPEADAERLRRGGGPFGPPERPRGGYTALPTSVRDDPEQARPWVDLALDHVAALPPRAPRPAKAPKKPRGSR